MDAAEIDLLDARIASVEKELREVVRRLDAFDHAGPSSVGPLVRDAQTTDQRTNGLTDNEATDQPLGVLIGRAVLIVGGGYLLRALTEIGYVPQRIGVVLAFAYALAWIAIADREVGRGRRLVALVDASTAALIASGLIWETATRFHFVGPSMASVLLGIATLVFIAVSVRRHSHAMAIVAAVMMTFTSIGLAIGTADVLPPMIAATLVGVIALVLHLHWAVTLILAMLGNFLALGLMVMAAIARVPYSDAAIEIVLASMALLWVVAIEVKPRWPESVQTSVVMVIGFGGASLFALHSIAIAIAILWSAIAIATAAIRRPQWRWQSIAWALGALIAAFVAGVPLIGAAALIAFVLMPPDAHRSRLVLLVIAAIAVFASIDALLPSGDRGMLAMERSLIVAAAAVLLSLLGRFRIEAATLARIVLGFGALKFLIEDIRMARATTLGIALAAFGTAMVIVARSKKESS